MVDLNFFKNQILLLLRLHHHLRLMNLVPQCRLDLVALLWIRGNGKGEEEQGPGVFYSGERRWGATHQKWRQRGWDTQTVDVVGINTAMVRSLHKRADGK